MLVPLLSAFAPERIYSAVPERCQHTVAPLADEMGCEVVVDKQFGDDAWIADMVGAKHAFKDVIEAGGTSVVCAQGGIIPGIIAWLSAQGTLPIDEEIRAKKASVWVLTFHDGKLIGADYIPSPLPVL